jgi:hypothetical protein
VKSFADSHKQASKLAEEADAFDAKTERGK